MANDKEINVMFSDANRNILADHYGLTPEFIKDNQDTLDRINKLIDKSLSKTNEYDPKNVIDSMHQMQSMIKSTFVSDTYGTQLQTESGLSTIKSDNGFRLIYGDMGSRDDNEIFTFNTKLFSNYRNLVSEYRNISRLIPEIHRCADMKSRDILSINEISKNAVNNVYRNPKLNTDIRSNDAVKLSEDPINTKINENIIERYDIENRLQRYFEIALEEGAKPVVVYPYSDIMEMARYNINNYNKKFKSFQEIASKATSSEAYDRLINECHERSNKLLDPYNFDSSTESIDNEKSIEAYIDQMVNKYVSKDDIKEYMARGLEDVKSVINKLENTKVMELALGNDIDKFEKIEEVRNNFRDLTQKVTIDGNLEKTFKNQIFNAIKTIDENIDFYNQSEAPMSLAINNLRRLTQFTGYHDDPQSGVIAYGIDKRKSLKPGEMDIPYHNIDNKSEFKSVLDEFDEVFSPNKKSILNDCLIKEYDSEDVIPVIVSGKHVGYYCIENSPYTGNLESVNKRNCNFTDMFINLGFNNDFALSPNPQISSSYSANGVNMPVIGGPTADIPGIGNPGSSSALYSGGIDLNGFAYGPEADDATHRNNIMKKIMFKVIKEKLHNKDLDEDNEFVDTVMSLIRDGAIVQNRIKITYVPEKYMCYFTPKLDGNGIPQSFMKDCLFTCYEKILVNMNTIMTRLTRTGAKDKISVNIGKAKNLGYSIRAIENSLTTRKLNVESPFTSLHRVLKSASLSETIIEPVYDGEKLFEYQDISQKNEAINQDDLEQKLSNEIITSLKCPITITNPYQEEDFASLAASRNAEYRFDIIKLQNQFGKIATKFVRLLIIGSHEYEDYKKIDSTFDIKNIEVIFAPPQNLNMKNANDTYGIVSTYVDNILSLVYDQNDDSASMRYAKNEMRKTLYMELFPGLSLDKYVSMADQILRESKKQAIIKQKEDSLNEVISSTKFEPLTVDPETGEITNPGTKGVGNGDDSGWG